MPRRRTKNKSHKKRKTRRYKNLSKVKGHLKEEEEKQKKN